MFLQKYLTLVIKQLAEIKKIYRSHKNKYIYL